MWPIRIALLVILGALVYIDSFLLRSRTKYSRLVENKALNIAIVAAHLVVTCAVVILPPAERSSARPDWLRHEDTSVAFITLGAALVCAGLTLQLLAFGQRKAIGLQGARDGLVTTGVYRYFRHPICTAVLWTSLGLALVMRNPDGLLALPVVFVAYLTQVLLEERHDLCMTFGSQYQAYRQTTRVFGPVWVWITILGTLLLIAASARI